MMIIGDIDASKRSGSRVGLGTGSGTSASPEFVTSNLRSTMTGRGTSWREELMFAFTNLDSNR